MLIFDDYACICQTRPHPKRVVLKPELHYDTAATLLRNERAAKLRAKAS